ncbi:DUF2249 domain-containing protein [Edaphobacter sp. 12200R-103]|jgi:uncharacterized protein (DUF2249 family)/quercetin dioxygenase-like cupin family protein|uniref:DUF2249 domain-containing protein n=1 Tax=Edaphobacter sp. 12200R-103 TaxID=2703788 RepID=UPI00192ED981|nr:DUF2249 domain-containing protein [Edaphobacter sp. 12200R-103]
MLKYRLNELIEFDDRRFNPKVLVNDPGYRMVLLNIKANQSVPEHATSGKVTIYVMRGHVTFYEQDVPCELRSEEVISVASGVKHRVDAHEDSALLVLATGTAKEEHPDLNDEIDIRAVPRPQRHPLIFAKFDSLPVGSSVLLVNDHDPVPLSQQFESFRPGQAAWEYLERGPNIFRIRITKVSAHNEQEALSGIRLSPGQTQSGSTKL